MMDLLPWIKGGGVMSFQDFFGFGVQLPMICCGYGLDKWCCNPGDDSELVNSLNDVERKAIGE